MLTSSADLRRLGPSCQSQFPRQSCKVSWEPFHTSHPPYKEQLPQQFGDWVLGGRCDLLCLIPLMPTLQENADLHQNEDSAH